MVHPTAARADNPIVQHVYTADPAPLVYNGRVYLYTGHDEDGSNSSFVMKDWRVWSSADMVNWTDHGSPLSLATFSWASTDAWAGQAVERDGKFYWYVPVTARATGRMAIGVAVSDSPTGPFRDALGHPLVENSEIDPTVFIDDDGQAYLYWGHPNLWYVKLNADMTSYAGSPAQIPLTTAGFGTRTDNPDRPTLYEEAPWVYKRNGLYYMVYAAKCCSEFIAYSTAPSPTGPWTYRGTVMPAQGSAFTNHPGIVDFQGNSYFFYHNGALPGGGGFTRSVAVEKFSYNADGTIPTINMTNIGAPQVGALDPYVRQEAETIAWGSGIETEWTSDGGMDVGWIEPGDSIKVKGVAFGAGASSYTARVASAGGGGTVELRLGSPSGTVQCAEHRRLAGLDHGDLPGERRDGNPGPLPAVHRRQRLPVQHELVAVHPRRVTAPRRLAPRTEAQAFRPSRPPTSSTPARARSKRWQRVRQRARPRRTPVATWAESGGRWHVVGCVSA
ncbi:glycoside hydrolase family 43 protein [Streptomyces sp. NBC_00285]|uniref:glycoside hydrolase family 43 protein n=1 Tax=Streptomyces sp. NBC_00285 TaxID=2975700 RepID=UPI003FA73C5C